MEIRYCVSGVIKCQRSRADVQENARTLVAEEESGFDYNPRHYNNY